jgi:bifunctional non-homologous end joining protein LigD
MVRRVLSYPAFVAPMLPSFATEPPKGEHWIHEIKFDGFRTVACHRGWRGASVHA